VLRGIINWFFKPSTTSKEQQTSFGGAHPSGAAQPTGVATAHSFPCRTCGRPATLHITEAHSVDRFEEIHLCAWCGHSCLPQALPPADRRAWSLSPETKPPAAIQAATLPTGIAHGAPTSASCEVQLTLRRIVINELHDQQFIYLQEIDGDRAFPIVIGIYEATGIDRAYKQLPSRRPLSHDAWLSTLFAVGAGIEAACIKELRETTYYAALRLFHAGQLIEVDLRPSDAVLLALKAKVPLVIGAALLAVVT
jgi:bifunctional DNase/RNase